MAIVLLDARSKIPCTAFMISRAVIYKNMWEQVQHGTVPNPLRHARGWCVPRTFLSLQFLSFMSFMLFACGLSPCWALERVVITCNKFSSSAIFGVDIIFLLQSVPRDSVRSFVKWAQQVHIRHQPRKSPRLYMSERFACIEQAHV